MTDRRVYKAQRMTSDVFRDRIGAFETVAQAKIEAERLVTEAQTKADATREAVMTELAQKRAEMMAKAEADVAQFVATEKAARMTEALRDVLSLSQAFEADFKASEKWLTSLVIQAVQRVLSGLPADQLDRELVRSAIMESGARWKLELYVSQTDHGRIEALIRNAGPEFACIESIAVKSELEPGQMLLLSAGGVTDITVDAQLQVLSDTIAQACQKSVAPA